MKTQFTPPHFEWKDSTQLTIFAIIKEAFFLSKLDYVIESESTDKIGELAIRLEEIGLDHKIATEYLEQLWTKLHRLDESGFVRDDVQF